VLPLESFEQESRNEFVLSLPKGAELIPGAARRRRECNYRDPK